MGLNFTGLVCIKGRVQTKWSLKRGGLSPGWSFIRGSTVSIMQNVPLQTLLPVCQSRSLMVWGKIVQVEMSCTCACSSPLPFFFLFPLSLKKGQILTTCFKRFEDFVFLFFFFFRQVWVVPEAATVLLCAQAVLCSSCCRPGSKVP